MKEREEYLNQKKKDKRINKMLNEIQNENDRRMVGWSEEDLKKGKTE